MVQPITAVSAPGHISTGVLCPLSASMWLEDTATPIAGLAVLLLENLNSQADSMRYWCLCSTLNDLRFLMLDYVWLKIFMLYWCSIDVLLMFYDSRTARILDIQIAVFSRAVSAKKVEPAGPVHAVALPTSPRNRTNGEKSEPSGNLW